MLTEAFVPGTAYHNLGHEASAEGRYLASMGWHTAGHLEVIGTLATAGVGGLVARGTAGATRFAGGAYGKLRSIAGWERHHMPADSVSPLSRARGPAIQMEQADHALTMSFGNSAAAQAYRQQIEALIQQGRWREAMALEIRDVRRVAGSKYNEAVQQMLEYARSIGIID